MQCRAILIVEDEPDIRENLQALFELEGYKVFTAGNGKEGLKALRVMPRPCLILLDMLMPVMNGSEFLTAKEHEDSLSTIPVGIVSGVSDRPKLVGGAVAFLRKPLEFDGLLKFVKQYCPSSSAADPKRLESGTG